MRRDRELGEGEAGRGERPRVADSPDGTGFRLGTGIPVPSVNLVPDGRALALVARLS